MAAKRQEGRAEEQVGIQGFDLMRLAAEAGASVEIENPELHRG
jgi:hypothetical protein